MILKQQMIDQYSLSFQLFPVSRCSHSSCSGTSHIVATFDTNPGRKWGLERESRHLLSRVLLRVDADCRHAHGRWKSQMLGTFCKVLLTWPKKKKNLSCFKLFEIILQTFKSFRTRTDQSKCYVLQMSVQENRILINRLGIIRNRRREIVLSSD